MTKHCINHGRITYDCCRHCNGKDRECPEYLENRYVYSLGKNRNLCKITDTERGLLTYFFPSPLSKSTERGEKQ
jgi:hypothetical protein